MFKARTLWGRAFCTPYTLPYYIQYLQHTTLTTHHVEFYGGRKTGEPGEKPSWQGREQHIKQTQLTYVASRNRTRTTAVRGER
jgi:hypothetical protein